MIHFSSGQCLQRSFTFPGLNSGKSSVTPGSALAASFCMIPARGRLSLSGGPPAPRPWQGRSVSDSESEELLKSTLSPVEDGAMMEGRIMPSPSSPAVKIIAQYLQIQIPGSDWYKHLRLVLKSRVSLFFKDNCKM